MEAAFVFPLAILCAASLMAISIKMYQKVRGSALVNRVYAEEIIDPALPAESALRLRWLGIELLQEDAG